MARITSTAWFGPKQRAGWGWTPTAWQGWTFTLIWSVVVTVATVWFVANHHIGAMIVFDLGALLVFLVVTLLTGDPPGGPGFGP
jgi:hypothetical protein